MAGKHWANDVKYSVDKYGRRMQNRVLAMREANR